MENFLIKLRFLNDSKATNISATIFALQTLSDPLFLMSRWRFKKPKLAPLINAEKSQYRSLCLRQR